MALDVSALSMAIARWETLHEVIWSVVEGAKRPTTANATLASLIRSARPTS